MSNFIKIRSFKRAIMTNFGYFNEQKTRVISESDNFF